MLIVPQQREAEAKAEMFCPQPPWVSLGRQYATPRCPENHISLVITKSLAPNEERKTFLLGIQMKKKKKLETAIL